MASFSALVRLDCGLRKISIYGGMDLYETYANHVYIFRGKNGRNTTLIIVQ